MIYVRPLIFENNDLLDYATVGNIYQTLVPFYGSHYYDDYHDYYIGSIHERTKPIFVDNKVQNLYDAVCDFRDLYEDRISQAVYVLSSTNRTTEENEELLFLVKIQYVIFEYLLVLCETFGICDLYLLEETGFKKKLDAILDQIGGQLSI